MGGRVHTDPQGNVTGFSWPFSWWVSGGCLGCLWRLLVLVLWLCWPLAFLGHSYLGWLVEAAWAFLLGVILFLLGAARSASQPKPPPRAVPDPPPGPRDWSPRQP